MKSACLLVFLLFAAFVVDTQAYFRLPRMGETSEEYQNSIQEFRDAVKKHKATREQLTRRKPLARSSDNNQGQGSTPAILPCSQELMAERAQMYIDGQPLSPNAWTPFFNLLDPNVILSSNLIDAPSGVGKASVENLLLGINTQYQNITEIFGAPRNTFGPNSIVSLLSKSQGSIRVGVQYNITIFQELTFSSAPDCLVTSIFEFADSGKTAETLSLEFSADPAALTCERIKWVCGNHMPNFGTQNNNCMLLWKGTPAFLKNDTAMNDDLQLITSARTLTCANTVLSTIQNAGAALPAAETQFLCSLLGAPIAGVPGCWAPVAASSG